MKRSLLFVIIAFVFIFLACDKGLAKSVICCSDTVIVINPIPGQDPDPNRPRTPGYVPIEAEFLSSCSTVILSFAQNLGAVVVELTNISSFSWDCVIIDTSVQVYPLLINLGSGHYIITFTLPSGQQYQGEFNKP